MSGRMRALGLADDRSRTFREKLLPWRFYAVLVCLIAVLVPWMVAGYGFEYPDRARAIGLGVFVPFGLVHLAFAIVARRHQRG